jgi:hypothetical protein
LCVYGLSQIGLGISRAETTFLPVRACLLPADLFGDERGSRQFAVQAMFEIGIWHDRKVVY